MTDSELESSTKSSLDPPALIAAKSGPMNSDMMKNSMIPPLRNKSYDDEEAPPTVDKEDHDVDENEEETIELEEDVYSMLFVNGVGFNLPSMYCISIIGLQLTIISLFYYDLLEGGSDGNKLNIPLTVSAQVRGTEFLALPLAVMAHEDCLTALHLTRIRFNYKVTREHPRATHNAWTFTLFIRFVVGFLLVFVSFIQIMQADNVTDLFLNLESIIFVGGLDNAAYWLASSGFLKKELREAAETVKEVSFQPLRGNKRTITRRIMLFMTWSILVVGWAIVAWKQKTGFYIEDVACKSFTVSFGDSYSTILDAALIDDGGRTGEIIEGTFSYDGYSAANFTYDDDYFANITYDDDFLFGGGQDEYLSSLLQVLKGLQNYNGYWQNETAITLHYSPFSGTYKIGKDPKNPDRIELKEDQPVYYEADSRELGSPSNRDHVTLGRFEYCDGAWIFSIPAFEKALSRDETNCPGWLLRLPETEKFRLEEVGFEGWSIWTGKIVDATDFDASCDDCTSSKDCNYHGTCNTETQVCSCENDWVGNACEIEPPCLSVNLVRYGDTSSEFSSYFNYKIIHSDGTLATSLDDPYLFHSRPVFVNYFDLSVGMIFYSGSRWVHTEMFETDFEYLVQNNTWPLHAFWDGLLEALEQPDIFSDLFWVYVSEPTQSASPDGLSWSLGYDTSPIKSTFECAKLDCSGVNPCMNGGTCVNGRCECVNCYSGYRCEYSPVNEYVSTEFNRWRYNDSSIGTDGDGFPFSSDNFTSTPFSCDYSDFCSEFWAGRESCLDSQFVSTLLR